MNIKRELFKNIKSIEQGTWAMLNSIETNELPGWGVHTDEDRVTVYHCDGYCVRILKAEGTICIFTDMFEGFKSITKLKFFDMLREAFMERLEKTIDVNETRQSFERIEEGCGGIHYTEDYYEYEKKLGNQRFALHMVDTL